MNLPSLSDADLRGKKVILRLDLDTDYDPSDLRISSSFGTLDFLKEKKVEKILIIGHKGRPNGKKDSSLSLKPFEKIFSKWGAVVFENLRFDPREEKNDPLFSKELSLLGDFYVNEAFASSHRSHASIVGLPRYLPHAAGFRFLDEVKNISRIFSNPKRPVVLIVSGVKKDKIEIIKELLKEENYDRVLVGGRLPEFFGDRSFDSVRTQEGRLIIGNLTFDKEDITINTTERFKEEIKKAKTIVLAGVLGKYEDEGHRQGTKEIFEFVASTNAFKIAGGGDTEKAIRMFRLEKKFDWISVGGGAMLEFIARKTLPGIEALMK